MIVRLDIELTPDQVNNLQRKAILAGYYRIDPNKRWSEQELKGAVREGLKVHIRETIPISDLD